MPKAFFNACLSLNQSSWPKLSGILAFDFLACTTVICFAKPGGSKAHPAVWDIFCYLCFSMTSPAPSKITANISIKPNRMCHFCWGFVSSLAFLFLLLLVHIMFFFNLILYETHFCSVKCLTTALKMVTQVKIKVNYMESFLLWLLQSKLFLFVFKMH